MKKALLLVNLGTPDAPTPKDVGRYLTEFLTDRRVINLPFLKRQFLVRGIIVPNRAKESAKTYQALWTDRGSPLLYHTEDLANKLQELLKERVDVYYAMRYQNPSIASALEKIQKTAIEELIVLPLFPQYASATTGSVIEEVMRLLASWEVFPNIRMISSFAEHPSFIEALAEKVSSKELSCYDHILMSFHGLPVSQIKAQDRFNCCGKEGCCDSLNSKNTLCYKAQCFSTARALGKALDLPTSRYTVCFQSRLGKSVWIQPYTSDVLESLAKKGAKKLLVYSPAFVCDCLETTIEIGEEYQELFREKGGESLTLVEGLNSSPRWVEALSEIASCKSESTSLSLK